MIVSLNVEKDEELRAHIKDLIRGQIKSILKDELKDILKEELEESLKKFQDVKKLDNFIRDSIKEISCKWCQNNINQITYKTAIFEKVDKNIDNRLNDKWGDSFETIVDRCAENKFETLIEKFKKA